ncbi:hypothetical protein NP493_22g05054 [Ridgeia piscesae]|uniref:Anoctamin n=1 Tax=Ridgeia piscesae TaxID=27915 RepID=A0AAD9UKF6_RIDPI|nr:hypothetical protein NP493_22g05054 [Ridgeia piscesae]
MADPRDQERNRINGHVIPMENYGSLKSPVNDETVNFVDADELDDDGSDEERQIRVSSYNCSVGQRDQGYYFLDGKRKIDYMLVYEEEKDQMENMQAPGRAKSKSSKNKAATRSRHEVWRQKFMNNVKKIGLDMEEEVVEGDKKMIYYVKLHVIWDTLCRKAEDMCLRAPLQAHPNPTVNWSDQILKMLKLPNLMAQEVPNTPLDYYTCQFKRSKLNRFLGSDSHDSFFSNKDRQTVVYEILATTVYGKKKRAEVGIERLIEEGAYAAAFPLHDGPYKKPPYYDVKPDQLNTRQVLYEYWARWGMWYKYQPLDHIRAYFGEKIGIYFAWLGFYTAWLLPASIVGLLVFLYGLFSMDYNISAQETCNSGKRFKMCPLCDETVGCKYWYLSDVCLYTRISYLFDHPGTLFYAIFVSFWAVTFLEYWKRKNASLAHHWDCLDFEEEEETPRPEYASLCPTMEKNPVTGIKEPYFPEKDRIPRIMSGVAAIIIMMVLVVIFIIAVIMYRVLIAIPLFQNEWTRSQASIIASLTSACVNLVLIMALSLVYEKLAFRLTQWEMHRTQTEFENQLIFKVFLFQFVNYYSSIIYIGFFKGKFVGYPGNYNMFFGLRSEECQNGGCLIELAQQLAVIMVGKQIINNAQELLVPKVKAYIHHWKLGSAVKGTDKARWEEDYELIENEGLFQEYLEMVLQFGFITIFVAAFPLAPLFALLNNWMEIRLDAHKFVCETRRPVAEKAQNIGVWFTILDALAQLAVISNAFLIAFTSEFLPKLLYQYQYNWDLKGYVEFTLSQAPNGTLSEQCLYRDFRTPDGNHSMFYWKLLCVRLAFVIVFEHVVFGICRLIDIMVPDIPQSLELKIKRERYLAKQALADTDTLMQVCS